MQELIFMSCCFFFFISFFTDAGTTDTLPFGLPKFSLILDFLSLVRLFNVSTHLARFSMTVDQRDRLPDC